MFCVGFELVFVFGGCVRFVLELVRFIIWVILFIGRLNLELWCVGCALWRDEYVLCRI